MQHILNTNQQIEICCGSPWPPHSLNLLCSESCFEGGHSLSHSLFCEDGLVGGDEVVDPLFGEVGEGGLLARFYVPVVVEDCQFVVVGLFAVLEQELSEVLAALEELLFGQSEDLLGGRVERTQSVGIDYDVVVVVVEAVFPVDLSCRQLGKHWNIGQNDL